MLVAERRRRVLDWIMEEGSVSLDDLAQRLNVSLMTVRRDLDVLQTDGEVIRVRGGAIRNNNNAAPTARFEAREEAHRRSKSHLARYAVDHFVSDGDVVALEGGTTVTGMASLLSHTNLTVLTNGLNVVNRTAAFLPNITVMCCGGILRRNTYTFVGPQAEAFFDRVRVQKCFLSGTGLTLEDGLAEIDLLETEIKRALARCADKRILLIDSSKFGLRSLTPVLPIEEFEVIITDDRAPQDMVDALRARNIEVHVAPHS